MPHPHKKKIILQDKVTAAKESLRVQLQELQALDEQIKQAQKAVEDCQSKLAQSMSGAGDVDADNSWVKQSRHSSSRRLHRVWALVLRLSRQNSCRPRLPHDRRQPLQRPLDWREAHQSGKPALTPEKRRMLI